MEILLMWNIAHCVRFLTYKPFMLIFPIQIFKINLTFSPLSLFLFLIVLFFSLLHGIRTAIVMRTVNISYETSPRGNPILVLNYNRYVRNRESKKRVFWRCTKYYQNTVNCPGSVAISKPDDNGKQTVNVTRAHNDVCHRKREQDERRARSQSNSRYSMTASNAKEIIGHIEQAQTSRDPLRI